MARALLARVLEGAAPAVAGVGHERGLEGPVLVLAGAVEAMGEGMPGGRMMMDVTMIRPGDSHNRLRYRPEVLREAVGLFEGAAAFCDHPGMMDMGRAGGRSLRDLVGVYEGVRWDAEAQAIRGRLRLYPGADWLATLVREALADRAAGRQAPNIGVSADMLVVKTPIVEGNGYGRLLGWDVQRIVKVQSADIVFQPSAGGRFDRILEGAESWEGFVVCTTCGQDPCRCQGSGVECQVPGDGVGAAGSSTAPGSASGAREGASAGVAGGAGCRVSGVSGDSSPDSRHPEPGSLSRELEAVRGIRLELCRTLLDQRLQAAGLPQAAQDWLRNRYRERVFEAAELDGDIAGVRGMLGGIVAPGVVQGMGPDGVRTLERGNVRTLGLTEVERVQLAVDRLFGLPLPDAQRDVPRFSGIREAYLTITGDVGFTGRYDWERSVFAHVREADEVTTAVMANIVANSMTKKLVADYQAQPKWWLPIVVRVPVRDMKTQDRVLLYDFGSFPTVAENAAYVNLAWDDSKETYTPAKRGSTVYITLETIINDDLRAVARIPSKLAAAAAVTINEFVSGLFTANAGLGSTMADTKAVFHADHGGNTGATALSSANLRAAMIVMAKQTNSASKRIGVIGKYLLVPPDLMYTAQVIAGTQSEPGTANNDINPLAGRIVPIAVPQFTDTNNWYVLADPTQIESIELGFLNGREEPELLVQDNPTSGTVFTNDAITYKVRWIFGGGWLDYRGAYGSVVA